MSARLRRRPSPSPKTFHDLFHECIHYIRSYGFLIWRTFLRFKFKVKTYLLGWNHSEEERTGVHTVQYSYRVIEVVIGCSLSFRSQLSRMWRGRRITVLWRREGDITCEDLQRVGKRSGAFHGNADRQTIGHRLAFAQRKFHSENEWESGQLRCGEPRRESGMYSGGIIKRRWIETTKGGFQKQSSDVVPNFLSVSGYFLIWIHSENEEHNEDGEEWRQQNTVFLSLKGHLRHKLPATPLQLVLWHLHHEDGMKTRRSRRMVRILITAVLRHICKLDA